MKNALANMAAPEALPGSLYSELSLLYRRLEEETTLLNPGCNKCGTCCNFTAFDHILYASSIEVGYITQHVKVPDFTISDNVCPFLKENQCSIRDFRTLGCRIFYCNPHYKENMYTLYEKYYFMIKELLKKFDYQLKYLPFLSQLNEFKTK